MDAEVMVRELHVECRDQGCADCDGGKVQHWVPVDRFLSEHADGVGKAVERHNKRMSARGRTRA